MDDAPLSTYAKLLDDVIGVQNVVVDARLVPRPGSPAEAEMQAGLTEAAAAGVWGDEPIRASYAAALMQYDAALGQARAMVALMTGAFTAIPVIVLARALVEMAAQAWWLLEPEIGHVSRVCRLQVLRFRSAREGERAAEADGLPEERYHLYTETTAQVEEYSRGLKLPVPERSKVGTYTCGSEKLPSTTNLIGGMFDQVDVPSVYNLYSGYSHGMRFALRREYEELTGPDRGMYYCAVLNPESSKGAIAIASYALHPPAERLFRLFGLALTQQAD